MRETLRDRFERLFFPVLVAGFVIASMVAEVLHRRR